MKTNALTLRLMAAHCVIKNYFTGNELKKNCKTNCTVNEDTKTAKTATKIP